MFPAVTPAPFLAAETSTPLDGTARDPHDGDRYEERRSRDDIRKPRHQRQPDGNDDTHLPTRTHDLSSIQVMCLASSEIVAPTRGPPDASSSSMKAVDLARR
jgi:hypothetical protein